MSRRERTIPEFVLDNLDNLKAEALKQGYSVPKLAAKIGVSRTMVHNLAEGWRTPSKNSYNRLAVVLGWQEWV